MTRKDMRQKCNFVCDVNVLLIQKCSKRGFPVAHSELIIKYSLDLMQDGDVLLDT